MLLARLDFGLSIAALLAATASAAPAPGDLVCVTESQPNPLKDEYPDEVTGLLNATLAIAAIPLNTARRIVPYKILESAYRSLLPDFPEGKYPVLIQAAHDHDIHYQDFKIPDFSRTGYEFPFIDLLGDGHSSFRWAPQQLITATNLAAIEGSQAYGTIVYPATFDPQCDAYGGPRGQYFKAKSVNTTKHMTLDFKRQKNPSPSTQVLNFYQNITNQPSFADGKTCDRMIRFFNTSVTAPPYAPIAVRGSVRSDIGPFPGKKKFKGIEGIQVATGFIERNYLDCKSLAGL